MKDLAEKTCIPCQGGVPPLAGAKLGKLVRQIPEWKVVDEHHLIRRFDFENFREALDFVDRVGELAEEQRHHPDIRFGWGYAEVTIFTHKINGLTESDFILAAKISHL